jgi:hypothetical protein
MAVLVTFLLKLRIGGFLPATGNVDNAMNEAQGANPPAQAPILTRQSRVQVLRKLWE